MSTRRGGGGDDGATVRPRPLSASRRFPSPNSLSLHKENTNPRRSNPNHKTLPRGRSSSPSDLPRSRPHPRPSIDRQSAQKPTKAKPSSTQKPKTSITTSSRSSIELKKPSQDTATSNSKYPSRLHEKLVFLEGKVKRIASDIKKTKEMLDMNNPDASKVILSDIQDKISGIEKAIVHVVSDKEGDDENDNALKGKILTKGLKLNSEELEARLFPHQRLLRDRIVVNKDSKDDSAVEEEKVLSPIEDNSVAVEFLALIGKEKEKVNAGEDVKEKGGGNGGLNDKRNEIDALLGTDEKLDDFDANQENKEKKEGAVVEEEMDEAFNFRLNGIGSKAATGGWFVNEGEAVLLAHHDGSCTYYDITNCEVCVLSLMPDSKCQSVEWCHWFNARFKMKK